MEAVQTTDWNRTTEQMVEATLVSNYMRLAGRYRRTTFPELAQTFARRIKPVLQNLSPVVNEQSFKLAQHVIDRSLVSIDVLSENDLGHLTAYKQFSGEQIRNLMRINNVTIKQLAMRMQITLKRVREVRENGVKGNCYCRDWYEAITASGIFSAQ